ncbi:MAG: hypothetical protein ACJ8AW_53430 [Rhodopila sp.]
MPTIDQLAPATSASDADEFVVSQASVAKKITCAQVLNGVQPQIAMPADSLLGRASSGTGAPEVIAVGDNLILNSRTLSATATPFSISGLPTGIVPATGDLVAVSQAGTNVAVTYGQLIGGLSGLANIDVSQALVTPSGTNTEKKLADLAATSLPVSGGTLTGQLSLSGKPVLPAEAANKAYVDERILTALALTGGSMSGTLTLAAAPQSPLDSVTKGYADALAATLLPLSGASLSGALLLNSDPSNNLQAATKRYADLKLTRTGDTLSGMLTLAADPTGALHASTKNYVDTKVGDALPKSGGTMLGSLVLASDPSVNAQAATKQYVD